MKKITITVVLTLSTFLLAMSQENNFPKIGNVTIYQGATNFRGYDIVNKNKKVVSRFEATSDGSGQLWFANSAGDIRTVIRGNATSPSAIAGELIIGKFARTSSGKTLFVNGTSEFTGNLYGQSNFILKQKEGLHRGYDVNNFDGITVSRFEATHDGTGQLWFKDKAGNVRVAIRSNTTYPSAIAGELMVGKYSTKSSGKTFFVNGTSEFTGTLSGQSNIILKQQEGLFRGYDVQNFEGTTVSRFEARADGSGQLWFKNKEGDIRAVIRSNATYPSAIAGELMVGKYSTKSSGKTFFVNGTSEFTGTLNGQSNIILKQQEGLFRGYDVQNFEGTTVSRFEARADGSGQLWFKNKEGDIRAVIRSNATYPSAIAGELMVGKYSTKSSGKTFFVNGTSEFTGTLNGQSNIILKQQEGLFRGYDVQNFEGTTVSRFEARADGSGQLWFKNKEGDIRAVIRSNATYPSAIAGELMVGKYSTTSSGRAFFVNGTSEFTGNLYGQSNFTLKQKEGNSLGYNVQNFEGNTVSRFEARVDGSGQLWFKDKAGNTRVVIRSNTTYPSAIAGELIIGKFSTVSENKKLFVAGDSWIEGELGVDGDIVTEKVSVQVVNPPDYVFESDYKLRSLKETKLYIDENKHLPEIPSAKEMEANGVELGEMNMKLLKKIEELTLYQIELLDRLENTEKKTNLMNKKLSTLETENDGLKEEIRKLKSVR